MKDKSNTMITRTKSGTSILESILQQVHMCFLQSFFIEKSSSQRPMLSNCVNKCLGRSQKLTLYTNHVQVIRPEIMNVERIDNIGPIIDKMH